MILLAKLEYWVPLLHTLRTYRVEWLRNDLAAGVSVAAIQIPTAIAYAELAGFGPEVGLYASILPLVAYALFGSSRQLIVGPDAATCAIVAAVLVPLAAGDPGKYAVFSAILGLLVGGLCIMGGIMRLGFLADFLSRPVLTGLLNGIALSIIVGQLGKVLDSRRGTPIFSYHSGVCVSSAGNALTDAGARWWNPGADSAAGKESAASTGAACRDCPGRTGGLSTKPWCIRPETSGVRTCWIAILVTASGQS